jgi:Ni,Fe-hydrogenase III small subunit
MAKQRRVRSLITDHLLRMLRRDQLYTQVPRKQAHVSIVRRMFNWLWPPKSVFLRHLDCGSCNGCELELNALENPIYDIHHLGIEFRPSPRHADVLLMTGPFTRNLEEAAQLTFQAMSEPRRIITIGDCAKDGGIYQGSYALVERPQNIEEAIVDHVPGCPPTPQDIINALVKLDEPHPKSGS